MKKDDRICGVLNYLLNYHKRNRYLKRKKFKKLAKKNNEIEKLKKPQKMNNTHYYKPKILDNVMINGFDSDSVKKGTLDIKNGNIIDKKLISSYDIHFQLFFKSILKPFCNPNELSSVNKLLVIIKPDKKAFVYNEFPLCLTIKAARDLKKFEAAYKGDFSDITSLSFSDVVANLNPMKGDQIIWLFKINFHFGLYFDFTAQSDTTEMLKDMASKYKYILYYSTYSAIKKDALFNEIINDGWFPFINLLNGLFDKIISYYSEKQKNKIHIDSILGHFDKDKIQLITNKWWKNPILAQKKEIIQSGIDSYLSHNQSGYINCIKNLMSEIEGIIRLSCFKETGKSDLSVKDLKNYLENSGKKEFYSEGSLGFPIEFQLYLSNSIFKGFDLEKDEIPSSRHSYMHGVAKSENYTQERALQLILTLDQIVCFIGKTVD